MTHPLSEAGTSVEVKPLEWRSTHAGEAPVWRADTVMGRYTVVKGSAWGPEPSNTTWHCTDDEDGKARCQADFKARILSALIQPTPAETEPVAWHWEASDGQSSWPVWVMQAERPKHAPASAVPLYSEAQVSTLSRHLEEADDRLILVYDWAWTDETGEQRYARTPERAERLKAQGHKLTPVYTIESRRELGVEPIRRAKETVSHG